MAPAPTNRREELHEILVGILGSRNVYFQPPDNLHMNYPAITYERDYSNVLHADNKPYRIFKRYQITVIDEDPDSLVPDKVALLPNCSFIRWFATDELNHDIYNLYY